MQEKIEFPEHYNAEPLDESKIKEWEEAGQITIPEDYTKEIQERDKKLLKLTQFENSLKGLSPRSKKRAIDREAKKLGLNKI